MKKTRINAKPVLLAIIFLLSISLVFGCAGNTSQTGTTTTRQGASGQEPKDPLDKSEYYEIILLVSGMDPRYEQFREDTYFAKILKEKFNFGYQYIDYAGDRSEKAAIMLAAGDYPELVATTNELTLKAYVEADALIPMDDLISKYGPNFARRHESRLPYWKAQSGIGDDKVWFYTVTEPNLSYGISVAINEWKIRSDILEQQGYPPIRNEDDVYDVIKQGVADNPTTDGRPTAAFAFPLLQPNDQKVIPWSYNQGRLSHMTHKYGSLWDPYAEKFINPVEDYTWKESLAWYNRFWRDGLFDRDMITTTGADYNQKMSAGYALSTFFYNWNWQNWNTQLAEAGKDYRYIPFPTQLKSMKEKGEEKIYPITNGEIWSSFSFTKNVRYPERIMEVLDWCATDEGLIAMGWGQEGEQYEINSQGLRVPTKGHMDKWANDPEYRFKCFGEGSFGLFGGLDDNGQNFRMTSDAQYLNLMIDPKVFEVYGHYGWSSIYDSHNKNDYFKADYAYPLGLKMVVPSYSDSEQRDYEKIERTVYDYTVKLITAETKERFESLYNELLAELKKMGIDSFVNQRNDYYNELMKNIGE